ncbi:MAG TPA: hypothetical protein DDZ29_10120 [Alteromonas mediterranea]|nr:hypothetical protein [Alteromonas mediterranea]
MVCLTAHFLKREKTHALNRFVGPHQQKSIQLSISVSVRFFVNNYRVTFSQHAIELTKLFLHTPPQKTAKQLLYIELVHMVRAVNSLL